MNAKEKIEKALQGLMHLESAAISPQTNKFIEDGREALALLQTHEVVDPKDCVVIPKSELPDKLSAGVKNAVKPNYDINIICPNCKQEGVTNNGEWLLWCGNKEAAQALLDAGKTILKHGGGE